MSAAGEALIKVVADSMIRSWAHARAMLGQSMSFCSVNTLHPDFGRLGSGDLRAQGLIDAEQVQKIVAEMDDDMRQTFEVYHLGLPGIRDRSHKRRWLALGIAKRTYYQRVRDARRFIGARIDLKHQS